MAERRLLAAAVLLGLALAAAGGYAKFAGAAGGEPGSAADPLVTKSYVEEYVANYVQKALQNVQGPAWQVKVVPAGRSFLGGAGTEFILRAGTAVAVDPTGNGIPDVTAGTSLPAGQPVAANHLYIVPRDDGRGFLAKSEVVVMYRGRELQK